jgi:two-component system chemotaxis response regulator CheB
MIVEGSAMAREQLMRIISADPGLSIAGVAASGEEALAIVDRLAPDVISMDVQLPGMEGFETTRRIMAHRPTPIVIVSGLDGGEVELTMKALKAGALSVVEKPVATGREDYQALAARLCTQLRIMSDVKVVRRRRGEAPYAEPQVSTPQPTKSVPAPIRLLAIGASTGGPNALMRLLGALEATFPVPIVIVQHMNARFMEGFAEWLSGVTPFAASVVNGRTMLERGHAYLAPGDRHLRADSQSVVPDDSPAVGGHRPSANVLFSSIARAIGASAVGVLLTGMGEDGAVGLSDLRASGAYTIAEDETTAVVYGMPAAAVQRGAVVESLPINRIPARLSELVASRKAAAQ